MFGRNRKKPKRRVKKKKKEDFYHTTQYVANSFFAHQFLTFTLCFCTPLKRKTLFASIPHRNKIYDEIFFVIFFFKKPPTIECPGHSKLVQHENTYAWPAIVNGGKKNKKSIWKKNLRVCVWGGGVEHNTRQNLK